MLTVLFIISLLFITTLIGVKMYEIQTAKRTALSHLFVKFDGETEQRMNAIKVYFEKEKARVHAVVVNELPRQLHGTIITAKETVQKKYQSLFPNIRGVRVLNTDRDASPFLQNLSVERQRDGKGRIEDNLNL